VTCTRRPHASVELTRHLPILAILVVAAAVRFPALPQKGIVDWDEASYLSHARLVASGARAVLTRLSVELPAGEFMRPASGFEADTRWGKLRGEPTSQHRPSHTLSLAFGMLFLGEYAWAGQAVAASFGVLTVAIVYVFVRSAWGTAPAILAAAVLAASGLHALYSAEALPDSAMLFFWSAALLLHRRALDAGRLWRHGLAAGASLGIAVTFNERALLFLPWLGATQLLLTLRDWLEQRHAAAPRRTGRNAASMALYRTAVVAAGCLLAVGAIAGVLAAVHAVSSLVGNQVPGLPSNYVQSFAGQFDVWRRSTGSGVAPLAQFLVFPYLAWRWESPLTILLVGAGATAALVRRDREDPAVISLLVVSYVFYALAMRHVAHYYLPAIVPIAVLAGRWLTLVPAGARLRVAGALSVLVVAWGAPRAADLAATSSGYQQASELAIRETGGKHLSNYWGITGFYTGNANAIWPQDGMDSVRRAIADGYWLAIIASTHDNPGQVPPWELDAGPSGVRLVAEIPNPAGASLSNIHGGPRGATDVAELMETESRASGTIRIYDLRPLLSSGPTPSFTRKG